MAKTRTILLALICLCGTFVEVFAQPSQIRDTLTIDASDHSYAYDRDKNLVQGRPSTYQSRQAFLVALNDWLYSGEYLNHIILPYEKLFRKISFIQDKKSVNKYTSDPDISSVVAIRVNKRIAWAIYQRLRQKGIVNLSYQ